MESKPTLWIDVDEQGRLAMPPEVAEQYGLKPAAKMRVETDRHDFKMHRPVTQLTKVYIEPTVACNLDYITCFCNARDQPIGQISHETFTSILEGLKAMHPIPNVYFEGIGEPLFHPRTVEWIRQIKALGVKVELITNGTMLVENKSREVIEAGLAADAQSNQLFTRQTTPGKKTPHRQLVRTTG
jgi:uncharacterized radical SAM superfamily Fe-S cluster-containing enzyme